MNAEPIRVLLVDDHAVVREGYRRLLEAAEAIVVGAEAADGEQAYRLFCAQAFDVVVMDISLPGISGIEVLRRMLARDAETRVLVFSMHEDAVFARRAFQAGARGYLSKSSAPDVLVEAVLAVARGRQYVGRDLAQELAFPNLAGEEDGRELRTLTEREFEIFRLLAEGRPLPEISQLLKLTQKTVANYQTNIRQKLGVENSAQLLRLALENGLVGKGKQGC